MAGLFYCILSGMSTTIIYAVCYPDLCPFYIGKTDTENQYKRKSRHLNGNMKSTAPIVKALERAGMRPAWRILEQCSEAMWAEREAYWIALGKRFGLPLVNQRPGGNGGFSHPVTWGEKISAGKMGHPVSDASKIKMSERRIDYFDRVGRPARDAATEYIRLHPETWNMSARKVGRIVGVTHKSVQDARRTLKDE